MQCAHALMYAHIGAVINVALSPSGCYKLAHLELVIITLLLCRQQYHQCGIGIQSLPRTIPIIIKTLFAR
jgi:hypothetical protein